MDTHKTGSKQTAVFQILAHGEMFILLHYEWMLMENQETITREKKLLVCTFAFQ